MSDFGASIKSAAQQPDSNRIVSSSDLLSRPVDHSKDGEAVGPHVVVVLLIYLEATRLERIGDTARVTAIQKVVGCYTHSGTQTYCQLQ